MRIALAGFGTVGQAFVRMLDERRGDLYTRHGLKPMLVAVGDSGGAVVAAGGLDAAALLAVKRDGTSVATLPGGRAGAAAIGTLLAESGAEVLVEVAPSDWADPQPATQRLMAALRGGCHVISVNKAPLATAMGPLREMARHNGVALRFSGTVGAGSPMLAVARHCICGDEVLEILAAANGTTNYILWRMHAQGASFDEALREAQQRGYAETDPSADVDGIDLAAKVVILSNAVLGQSLTLADVPVEGIRDISPERVAEAAKRGKRIRLVGVCGAVAAVRPMEIDAGGPLDTPESLNAMLVRMRYSGELVLRGRGAGGHETATAIMRDLVELWHDHGAPS